MEQTRPRNYYITIIIQLSPPSLGNANTDDVSVLFPFTGTVRRLYFVYFPFRVILDGPRFYHYYLVAY